MNNLEKAREAFLNAWFNTTSEGSHWTNGMSVDVSLAVEKEFNTAFAAAINAAGIGDIPVAEYQMLDESGKWLMTTMPDYDKQDHAWKTSVRELVDAVDVRVAMANQDVVTQVWKTAFEEATVTIKRLKDGIAETSEETRTLKAEIESLNKQIEKDQAFIFALQEMTKLEDRNGVLDAIVEIARERDEAVLKCETLTAENGRLSGDADTSMDYESEPLRTAIQTVQGSKQMAATEVLVTSVGHIRDLFEIVKHAEDHPAVVLFAQLLAENAEKAITDYLEVSVGFYRQIYRVAMKFEDKVDWYGWVRGLAEAFEDAGQRDDAVQLGLLIKHMKTERKMLHQATKALKPFAKSGQLFGAKISDYDETVYNPAAGPEYFILGSHLRQARATYINIKGKDAC